MKIIIELINYTRGIYSRGKLLFKKFEFKLQATKKKKKKNHEVISACGKCFEVSNYYVTQYVLPKLILIQIIEWMWNESSLANFFSVAT